MVDLSSNQISNFHSDVFTNTPAVLELNLNNNKIRYIINNDNTPAVLELNLNNNKIRYRELFQKKQVFALTNRGIVPIYNIAWKPGFLKETSHQQQQ